MDTARKLLRLFESARECATLLRVLRQTDLPPTEKALLVAYQAVMMAYWAAENLYVLARLKILPLGRVWTFRVTVWLGLIAYLLTMAIQVLALRQADKMIETAIAKAEESEGTGKAGLAALLERRGRILMTIAKESADNIWLLPLLRIVRTSRTTSIAGSLGSLYQAVVSLYMRYK